MLRVRNKRKFDEVLSSKENSTPAKKKTMDLAFSFTNPRIENDLKNKAMGKKKTVKVLGSCENRMHNSGPKKQQSIKDFYSNKSKTNNVTVFKDDEKCTDKQHKNEGEKSETKLNSFQLLCQEQAPEKYWEMLAEERRKALEYALEENKKLAEEIDVKDKTIHELEDEMEELKETASHAEFLASVIEDMGKDTDLLQLNENSEKTSSNFDASESDDPQFLDGNDSSEDKNTSEKPSTSGFSQKELADAPVADKATTLNSQDYDQGHCEVEVVKKGECIPIESLNE